MKTSFRKVLSLATASALALSMAIVGSAAEGDTLTRGEMAKLLVEGAGLSDQVAQYQAQESVFQDVAEDSEYKGYINLAYAQGLVSGTGGDTFSPDAQTTQVEAAAAIMQYAGVPDAMLDSWPAAYNETAQRVGLTDGITYNGSAAVTEGQFQAMLTNGSDLVGKPYIGITWKANDQDYAGFKAVIAAAGGSVSCAVFKTALPAAAHAPANMFGSNDDDCAGLADAICISAIPGRHLSSHIFCTKPLHFTGKLFFFIASKNVCQNRVYAMSFWSRLRRRTHSFCRR